MCTTLGSSVILFSNLNTTYLAYFDPGNTTFDGKNSDFWGNIIVVLARTKTLEGREGGTFQGLKDAGNSFLGLLLDVHDVGECFTSGR